MYSSVYYWVMLHVLRIYVVTWNGLADCWTHPQPPLNTLFGVGSSELIERKGWVSPVVHSSSLAR